MNRTEFQIIFIMLGDSCNFKCTYCMQGDHNECVTQPVLSSKLIDFLDNYKSKDKTYICFWGGEPLLYFQSIREIVARYKDKFMYETVSNGSLLTREIVDFFNEHRIRLNLSHDGEITEKTRKVDVLKNDNIKSLYEDVKIRSVNVTYSSASPSIESIIKSYPNNQMITINTMINTTDTDISRKYADFDYHKYEADIKYLLTSYEEYLNGDTSKWREYNNVEHMIQSLQIYLNEGRKANRCFDCGRGMKMLNVDCDGNLYMCHNSRVKIGTVTDKWEDVESNINNIISKSRVKCNSCAFNKVCGGNCMMLSGVGETQKCKLSKMFYSIFIPWMLKMKDKIGGSDVE